MLLVTVECPAIPPLYMMYQNGLPNLRTNLRHSIEKEGQAKVTLKRIMM